MRSRSLARDGGGLNMGSTPPYVNITWPIWLNRGWWLVPSDAASFRRCCACSFSLSCCIYPHRLMVLGSNGDGGGGGGHHAAGQETKHRKSFRTRVADTWFYVRFFRCCFSSPREADTGQSSDGDSPLPTPLKKWYTWYVRSVDLPNSNYFVIHGVMLPKHLKTIRQFFFNSSGSRAKNEERGESSRYTYIYMIYI